MKIRVIRLPFLLPTWAAAQVLLPRTIFLSDKHAPHSPAIIAHELHHLTQLRARGLLLYWIEYLWQLSRHGYDTHPMELAAIQHATRPAYKAAAEVIYQKVLNNPKRITIATAPTP